MLFYGFVWEDEAELFTGSGDDEWEEVVAKSRGIADPWAAFPAEIDQLPHPRNRESGDRWIAEHRAELDAWSAARKAISVEYGTEIDHHGSGEWQVPVIKIAGAGYTAARGYPHAVAAGDLAVGPDWDGKLARFIADLGIDATGARGPGWFIASWWG